jgi:cephalosporin hydroxylase
MTSFDSEVRERIEANGTNASLRESATSLMKTSISSHYSYNFSWLGRPIIQYPQDVVAMQELIWSTQPELIIETGIAHGGSLILSASMLELNAVCGGPTDAKVIGVDIEIRAHNRKAIEAHPLYKRIEMIEGSSIAPEVIEQVSAETAGKRSVLVCLDSNHTHAHVLAELQAYAPLVSPGSYCVVFDTIVDDLPAEMFGDRPWGPGNNPKSAVREYLKTHPEFVIDTQMDRKLLVSVAPEGYLKRIRT